jgi:hypothetical protein
MPTSVAEGVPVEGVPMGVPLSEAHAEAMRRVAREAEDRFRRDLRSASQHELDRLHAAGLAAHSRIDTLVGSSVRASVEATVPTALARHIASTDAVRQLTIDVEARVRAKAERVVAQLADREVAERALSAAVEQRCRKAVADERASTVLAACAAGAAAGALVAALFGWHGVGRPHGGLGSWVWSRGGGFGGDR